MSAYKAIGDAEGPCSGCSSDPCVRWPDCPPSIDQEGEARGFGRDEVERILNHYQRHADLAARSQTMLVLVLVLLGLTLVSVALSSWLQQQATRRRRSGRRRAWRRMRLIAAMVGADVLECSGQHPPCPECGLRWSHDHVCEATAHHLKVRL